MELRNERPPAVIACSRESRSSTLSPSPFSLSLSLCAPRLRRDVTNAPPFFVDIYLPNRGRFIPVDFLIALSAIYSDCETRLSACIERDVYF